MLMLIATLTGSLPAAAQVPAYVPGPGDVLEIQVLAASQRQEEFAATVSPAGTIHCPLIGEFRASTDSLPALEHRLALAYGNGYYVHPDVLVDVRQYAGKISVQGEVRHPGLYPYGGGMTLLGAIELAGGVTDFASPHHVRLLRSTAGRMHALDADLGRIARGRAPDIALQRDDRIEVRQRWF